MLNQAAAIELKEALESGSIHATGKLPPLFAENERIVDPASKEGQDFDAIMRGITKRLWPDWDFDKMPVSFLLQDDFTEEELKGSLSDSNEPNAYVFSGHKPALVVFNKEMLRFCKNEDEIAFVLGHELNHVQIRNERGSNMRITETEEIEADLRQIPNMIEAGYNPFAGRDWASRFNAYCEDNMAGVEMQNRVLGKIAISLIDEHASDALRASYINNFIAAQARLKGAEGGFQSRKKTPKNKDLNRIMKNAEAITYFEALDKDTGDGRSFEQLSTRERLDFILKHIPDATTGFNNRPKHLSEWLEATESDLPPEELEDYGRRMLTELIKRPEAFNSIYGLIAGNLMNENPNVPLGELKEMEDSISRFVGATTKEEAIAASKDMAKFLESYPDVDLQVLSWPGFRIPTKDEILKFDPRYMEGRPLSWNKQVKWALEELKETGDFSAGKALLLLGTQDKRLYDACPIDTYLDMMRKDKSFEISKVKGAPLNHLLMDYDKGLIKNVVVGNPLRISAEPWDAKKYQMKVLPRKLFADDIKSLSEPLTDAKKASNDEFMAAFPDWLEENAKRLELPKAYNANIGSLTNDLIAAANGNIVVATLLAANVAYNENADPKKMLNAGQLSVYNLLYEPYAKNAQTIVDHFSDLLAHGGDKERQFVRDFFLDPTKRSKMSMNYLLASDKTRWPELNDVQVFKMPPDFPLNVFISENKDKLFTLEEQSRLLNLACHIPSKRQDWWQKTLDYEKPKQISDNLKILQKLERFVGASQDKMSDSVQQQVSLVSDAYLSRTAEDTVRDAQYASMDRELDIKRTEPKGGQRSDINIPEFLETCPKVVAHLAKQQAYISGALAGGEWKSYSSVLRAQIKNKEVQWPSDPVKLVKIYKTMEHDSLFPNRTWQQNFIKRVDTAIGEAPSLEIKIQAAETLLMGEAIKNVAFRKSVLSMWADAVLEQQKAAGLGVDGKDDGSAAYLDSTKVIAQRIKANTGAGTGVEMLSILADKLETQRDASYYFRDTYQMTAQNMKDADGPLRMGEALMVLFSENDQDRKDCIEFLTNKADDDKIKKMGVRLKDAIRNCYEIGVSATVSQDKVRSMFIQNREGEYYRSQMRDMHENYWNLPLPARAAIMDELLVPSDKRSYGDGEEGVTLSETEQSRQDRSNKAYQDAYELVVKKLMPKGMKYGDQAREFLDIYRSVIPESQRNLFLSVMLSVEKAVQDRGDVETSIGRRLSMILDMMGPAERKLGQAIHSHPMTPADIRDDMGVLKYQASPGTRWEAWEDFDRTVHPDYQKQIKRLGKFLGSASYFKSFDVERTDGSEGVIQFQRPNVLTQAREGFRLLELFVKDLHGRDQGNAEICDIMSDMLSQAKKMSGTETCSEIGAEQAKTAQQIYNGVKVKVGDKTFTVSTASWRAHGPEFRDQDKMSGVHFNQLAEVTPDELEYKRAVAKAYMTVELRNLLSGKAFDHDRHGAQLRVDVAKNHIGLFDHGAFHAEVYRKDGSLVQPWESGNQKQEDYQKVLDEGGRVKIPDPTDDEKRMLSNTVFKALQKYLEDKTPMAQTLYDEIKRIKKDSKELPEHLIRVQRALLALNDFIGLAKAETPGSEKETTTEQVARYVNEQDMIDILQGLFNDKERQHVDPVIRESLEEQLRPVKRRQAVKMAGNWLKKLVGSQTQETASFDAKEEVVLSQDKVKMPLPPAQYDAPPKSGHEGAGDQLVVVKRLIDDTPAAHSKPVRQKDGPKTPREHAEKPAGAHTTYRH